MEEAKNSAVEPAQAVAVDLTVFIRGSCQVLLHNSELYQVSTPG